MVSKRTLRKSKKDKKHSRIGNRLKQKTIKKRMFLGKKEQKELRKKLWGKSKNIKMGGFPTFITAGVNPFSASENLVNSSYLSTSNNIA